MFTKRTAKHASALIAFAFVLGVALQAGVTAGKTIFPSPPLEVIHQVEQSHE